MNVTVWWLSVLCVGLFSGSWAWGEAFKGLPRSVPRHGKDMVVLRELMPKDDDEAAKVFRPSGAGVRRAMVKRTSDGRRFVLLPVDFQDGKHSRTAWDVDVKADWSRGESVGFDFTAGRHQDVLGMVLYLRSGTGWYVANFGLDSPGTWNRVVIPKSAFATEGQPKGWGTIDCVRISCWKRSEKQDGWLGLANLGIIREDRRKRDIVIIQGDSCAANYAREGNSFARFAENLRTGLRDIDLPADMLSDLEVSAKRLQDYKLVILPYNPQIPDQLMESLKVFVAGGGKVLAFYDFPHKLQQLLKFTLTGWGKSPQGAFGGFLATEQALPGQPEYVPQASYYTRIPKTDGCRVIATWTDGAGKDTGIPAMMLTEHGAYVSHVWLVAKGANRKELLEALMGALIPMNWGARLKDQLDNLGDQNGAGSWRSLARRVRDSGNEAAVAALQEADKLRDAACELLSRKNWKKALPLVRQAQNQSKKAFFLTRRGVRKGPEKRLAWCHQAFGIAGWSWDKSIKFLSDCGFNGILANMCWAGAAYYDSKVLPRKPGDTVNYLQQCLDACKKYGVECHVWKVCFNMGTHAPKTFEEQMVREGRVQVHRNGTVNRRWLCPSHPKNQQAEIDTMVELAKRYPQVAGVHFDYIRFSGADWCFCPGCRKRFEEFLGKKLTAWPFDQKNGELLEKWRQFRRRAISRVVEQVHRQVKELRPDMKISAAVFSNWPGDRNVYGQDWGRWCRKGWLDFVCPMDYRDNDMSYRALVKLQREWCYEAKLYPGIGLSCWDEPNDPYRLVRQIEIVRRLRLDGFTVFSYDVNAADALKWCGMGSTK